MDGQIQLEEETFEELEKSLLELIEIHSESKPCLKAEEGSNYSYTHLDDNIKSLDGSKEIAENRNMTKAISRFSNEEPSTRKRFVNSMNQLQQQSASTIEDKDDIDTSSEIYNDKSMETKDDSGYFEISTDDINEDIEIVPTIEIDQSSSHSYLKGNEEKHLINKPSLSLIEHNFENIVFYIDDFDMEEHFSKNTVDKQVGLISDSRQPRDDDYILKTSPKNYDQLVVYLDDSDAFTSDDETSEQLYLNSSLCNKSKCYQNAIKDNVCIKQECNISDYLVLYIDDPDAFIEDCSEDEKQNLDNEDSKPVQENLEELHLYETPYLLSGIETILPKKENKYNVHSPAMQIINDWITRSKDDTVYQNDNNKKYESGGMEKHIFISDDPEENYDINHPEWKTIRQFTSNEDCYRVVKEHWESEQIPNPYHDLTFHSYRLRRTKRDCLICPTSSTKKRKLNNVPMEKNSIDYKRKLPCTIVIDRQLSSIWKEFKDDCKNEKWLLNKAFKEINNNLYFGKENIKLEYRRKLKRYTSNIYNPNQRLSLQKWMILQRKKLLQNYQSQRVAVRNNYINYTRRMKASFFQTTNKLQEARNEILKFNQFYCGLNNVDTTIIEGKLLEETERINSMYQQYEYYYK